VWKQFFQQFALWLNRELSNSGKRAIFLILDSGESLEHSSSKTVLPHLECFVLNSHSFDSNKKTAQLQRRALIEVADLVITFDGEDAKEASLVDTPCLSIVSLRNDEVIGVKFDHDTDRSPRQRSVDILLSKSLGILLQKKVDVVFHSYLDPTMGYGSSAEQMALAIYRQNVSIRFLPRSDALLPDWRDKADPITIKVCHHTFSKLCQQFTFLS